ncbi:putative Nuclear pore protein [Giardia duodenalis]|uniref:Nuclear pore complex protein n=1 Tax=Giardia intestinalis (strain ATCC 50803 / WB clone C6) TaxID=184922 RepID=D3KGR1_GIAIC|nr:putative Nuclear pore protein [Giardia intestinalis]KAE8303528.1 putative Nuclear pore protein [Giardia intestinalis]
MFNGAFLHRLRRNCNAGDALRECDPQLTQLVDAVFEDVLLYPSQHPNVVSSASATSSEIITGDIRARSGWSAPKVDQHALVSSFLTRSKSARLIKNIVTWLEQTYVPTIEPTAGIYDNVLEYLRAGQAEEAVDLLEKHGYGLQATMLAGAIVSHVFVGDAAGASSRKYVGIAGNLSFVEWMKKAQAYSNDSRTPMNERAIFGLLSGNPSYYLSMRKTKSPESALWAESRASLMNFILAACEGGEDPQLNQKADSQLAELLRHLPEEERLIASCDFLGLAAHLSNRCVSIRDGAASPADFIALSNLCLLALHVLASLIAVLNSIANRGTPGMYVRSSSGAECITKLRSVVGWYGQFALKLCNNERIVNTSGPISSDVIRASSLVLLISAHLAPAESVDLLASFVALLDDSHSTAIDLCVMALEATASHEVINSIQLAQLVKDLRLTAIKRLNQLANETTIHPLRLLGCSQIAISGRMPLGHLLVYSVHAFLIRRFFMFEQYTVALKAAEAVSIYAQAKGLFQSSQGTTESVQFSEDDGTVLYQLHSECTCLLSALKGVYCSRWTEISRDAPLSLVEFPAAQDVCTDACADTEQHLLDTLEFINNGQLNNYDANGRYSKRMAQLEEQFTDGIETNGIKIDRFMSLRSIETTVTNQCCLKYCELMFRMGSLYANSGHMDEARLYYDKLGEFVVWIVAKDNVTGSVLADFLKRPVIKDMLGYISKGILCVEPMMLKEE